MKTRNLNNLIIIISLILFSSCLDEKIKAKHITDDYYLNWTYEKSEQLLLKSSDDGKSGSIEIPETVFAIGFDNNFIIAKQHPNKEEEISKRLFGKYDQVDGYLLENPNDTIYLAKDDSIHQKNGKLYHLSNGWNPPSSLKPYKKITFYYIIDLRNKNSNSKVINNNKYMFDNIKDFEQKRNDLGISKNLNFTIIEKELE